MEINACMNYAIQLEEIKKKIIKRKKQLFFNTEKIYLGT